MFAAQYITWSRLSAAALISGSLILAGCGQGSGVPVNAAADSSDGATPVTSNPTDKDSITLTGSPSATAQAGNPYSFRPTASDSEEGPLTFTIAGKPSWATFDASTGALSGTPTAAQAGMYANITITASDGTASATLPAFSITVSTDAPTVSGTPASTVVAGSTYSFKPTATAATGKSLTFSIANRPSWATFSATTGLLSGTPTAAAIGSYPGIVISVTDGTVSASLPAFSITVSAAMSGSATLTWTPPTQNTDGSTLSDLSGYVISYDTNPNSLSQQITVTDPSASMHVISGLSAGTWYFAVKALTSSGVDSGFSNTASKTI
jgi:Putative Ig domain